MAARVVVFTPLRVYSMVERLARDAEMLYRDVCRVSVEVIPYLEDGVEPSVIAEGEECSLAVAEFLQSMLWLVDALAAPGLPGVAAQAGLVNTAVGVA